MRAYVLCGGFGTRLRSVTDGQKALVSVQGEPFLLHILIQLAQAGIDHVVLCAHYRADQVLEHLPMLESQSGLKLDVVVEAQPLGTGGALLNALREVPTDERYLLLNADTFLDASGYQIMTVCEGQAMLGVNVDDRSRYGALQVDDYGCLISITEKALTGPGLINGGVYAFSPTTFAGCAIESCSLERDLLPQLLSHELMKVLPYDGRFIDIGTPESLQLFLNEFALDIPL